MSTLLDRAYSRGRRHGFALGVAIGSLVAIAYEFGRSM